VTTERRLERDLPQILGDLATGPYPDYIDDVLATTAQRRQRAAWTFPERWLPMVDIARQPVLAPRIPWRSISMAFVIVALLLAAIAVSVGTQPRLPPPFGLARNGLIAYDAGGDIYTADPKTGVATAIVTGPETDGSPRYSPDGTHIVFERKIDGGLGQLHVMRSDGTDLTPITEPLKLTLPILGEPWEPYAFSPDGRSVLIASLEGTKATISIAQSDGSGVRRLDVGMYAYEPSFRPPDGAEILFVGNPGSAGRAHGLYAIDVSSGVVRPIVEPSSMFDLAGATWSPDGTRIAYWRWGETATAGIDARVHVISADGTADLELPAPPEAVWQAISSWSNDGSRLFLMRGYTPANDDVRPVVIPADGRSPGVELRYPGIIDGQCCSNWEWAPDDSQILGTPTDGLGPREQVIIDPVTGETRPVPWTSTSDPTWQRLAP
jgi:Tol biopolymer transport system component